MHYIGMGEAIEKEICVQRESEVLIQDVPDGIAT